MATPDDTLRALIRLIPPARALKEDLALRRGSEHDLPSPALFVGVYYFC